MASFQWEDKSQLYFPPRFHSRLWFSPSSIWWKHLNRGYCELIFSSFFLDLQVFWSGDSFFTSDLSLAGWTFENVGRISGVLYESNCSWFVPMFKERTWWSYSHESRWPPKVYFIFEGCKYMVYLDSLFLCSLSLKLLWSWFLCFTYV